MAEKADRYISSEEKLLKLIRRKDQHGKPTAEKEVDKGKAASQGSFLSGLKISDQDWLTRINNVLMLVVCISAVYFFAKTFWINQKQADELSFEDKGAIVEPVTQNNLAVEQKPLDYYLSIVEKRNIFNTSFEPAAAKKEAMPTQAIQEDPRNSLRLVGIVMDQKPQAIIEDSQSKETFFLFKGDKINEVLIEDIFENKVVLSYGGQRFELTNE